MSAFKRRHKKWAENAVADINHTLGASPSIEQIDDDYIKLSRKYKEPDKGTEGVTERYKKYAINKLNNKLERDLAVVREGALKKEKEVRNKSRLVGTGVGSGVGLLGAHAYLHNRKRKGKTNSTKRKVLTYGGSGLAGAGAGYLAGNLAGKRLGSNMKHRYDQDKGEAPRKEFYTKRNKVYDKINERDRSISDAASTAKLALSDAFIRAIKEKSNY